MEGPNHDINIATSEYPYAVVSFTDGIEIIKTAWAVYENGNITGSYFPPNVSMLELKKILCNKDIDYDKLSWSKKGEPYHVEKVFCLARDLEVAEKKRDLYIKLSDVESDENKNYEKLKSSRHLRCLKRMSDEYEEAADDTDTRQRKPLSIISNVRWNPSTSDKTLINLIASKPSSIMLNHTDKESNVSPEKVITASKEIDVNVEKKKNSFDEATTHLEDNTVASEVTSATDQGNLSSSEIVSAPKAIPSPETMTPMEKESLMETESRQKAIDFAMPKNSGQPGNTSKAGPPKPKKTKAADDRSSNMGSSTSKSSKTVDESAPGNALFRKVASIETMVKSLCQNGVLPASKPTFENKDQDLQIFPAKTKEEVVEINKKLKKRKNFYDKVCNAAVQIGTSQNVNTTVNNILNELLTFKAGLSFSFQGRSGRKSPFKTLRFRKVVHESMNRLKPQATKEEIDKGIKNWLYYCKKMSNVSSKRSKR